YPLPLHDISSFPTRRSSDLMKFSFVSKDPTAQVELLPPSARLPCLFTDRPFVFIGQCSSLTDFTLTLEGQSKDGRLTIKKKIPRSEEHTSELQSRFDLVCRL